MTGLELEERAEGTFNLFKVQPAFKGYQPEGAATPFPNILCISINNEVIHGIPDNRRFREGDVIKIDTGTLEHIEEDGYIKNYYDDGATTVIIGHGSAKARRIVKATEEALEAGILKAKKGYTNHDIARAIHAVAKREGFTPLRGYGGHGIGVQLHMEPFIGNEEGFGPVQPLEVGQRIAIEPMFCTGDGIPILAKNGWTIKTSAGVSAHFERTVTVTAK